MIEETIFGWLSPLVANGLFAGVLPDETVAKPCATYHRMQEYTPEDGDGPFGAHGYRFGLTAWADTYEEAVNLTATLRADLMTQRPGFLVTIIDAEDAFISDVDLYAASIEFDVVELASL